MEERTPPKPSKPSFAGWTPPPKTETAATGLPRSAFAGLSPKEAAEKCISFQREHYETLRDITLRNKQIVFARMLRAFAERGKDLSSITMEDCTQYREYLRDLTSRGIYSENTCSYMVRAWNSVIRAVFGVKGKPGEGLLMKNFIQSAKRVVHLNEEEMSRLIEATHLFPFRGDHNRDAFKTYLELAWATGARVGSLIEGHLCVGDIDWERQVVLFRHMKNKDHHTAVLTARAALALRRWCDHLGTLPIWKGEQTPVFIDEAGEPLLIQWVNKTLKGVAALAGISKPVSSHILRKSVGTLIGRENPKFAQLQLGISTDVYNEHYNQPLLEDRMAKRNILPGSTWKPTTPEEIAGSALLDLTSGKLPRNEFNERVARARQLKAQPEIRKDDDVGYQ